MSSFEQKFQKNGLYLPDPRLIIALDVPDRQKMLAAAEKLYPFAGFFKLGLEYFTAEGKEGVKALTESLVGRPLFLDLKFHDIPNTVAGAVRSAIGSGAEMLTVHASGGTKMIAAAKREIEQASCPKKPVLLAVTVLTGLSAEELDEVGQGQDVRAQVLRLAKNAVAAGADGLVCSPLEIKVLREALGEKPLLVVPGIRPSEALADDQQRTATPEQALADGADYLVIGRPITKAADPEAAALAITAEMQKIPLRPGITPQKKGQKQP